MNSQHDLRSLSTSLQLGNDLRLTEPETPDPRDAKTYYTYVTLWRRLAIPVAMGIFRLLVAVQVRGAENLPRRGPVILACNHITNFDVFPLQAASTRPIFFMGKAELYRQPLIDWWLRQLGSFPVERGAHDEWALHQAERVLYAGQVLGMFPEGKRNKGRGLHPAKTGVARLALGLDCPIVPAGLHGTQYLFQRVSGRAAVSIELGEPIYAERGETALSLTDRMMFALADLLPPEDRGAYRSRPLGF